MGKLTTIANHHTVDKGTEHYEKHGYTEVYDKYIPEIGKFELLEIGIWHGDSLRMWKEYNPELDIFAIDIDPNVLNFIHTNDFNISIGDQSNEELLNSIVLKSGPLDFIIDDGSHVHEHILSSFKVLWEHVKPGGYYFIEDLHAAYAQREYTIKNIQWFLSNKEHSLFELVCDDNLLIIQK
jgi:demethylmacrocin O-methyltransferase